MVDGTEKVTNKCSNGELLKMVHIKPKICDSEKLKQLLEKEQDMEIQDLSSSSEPEEIILDGSGETSDKGLFLTELEYIFPAELEIFFTVMGDICFVTKWNHVIPVVTCRDKYHL